MTIEEYVNYAIKNGLCAKYNWALAFFTLPTSNEYLEVQDKQVSLKINDELIPISKDVDSSVLDYREEITIYKDTLSMLDKDIKTTIGKSFLNYLLLERPLGKRTKYNNDISIGKIESEIFVKEMLSDVEKKDPEKIYVSDYLSFSNSVSFLRGMGDIFTVAGTRKMLLPPPGIKEFKKQEINKLKDKYGEDALKDYTHLAVLEEKLKDFDTEYLKGDPTNGILLSNKIKNMSRKKKYLIFGSEPGFEDTVEAQTIENSLSEEWSLEKEDLANMFNTSRLGSYAKGVETQESGLEAKIMGRATIGFLVAEGSCNTKIGFSLTVKNTKDIVGYTIIVDGKSLDINNEEEASKFLNKKVMRRSPRYCKSPNDTLCTKCLGKFASENPRGLVLGASNLGGKFVNGKMKAMHGKVLESITISASEILK